MMKRIAVTTALLAAFSSANAVRVLDPVERPVELALADLMLPTSTSGNVSFRSCAQCPISTHLLNSGSTFSLGERPVPFVEFLAVATDVRQDREASQATLVTVFLSVDNERITRIVLHRL